MKVLSSHPDRNSWQGSIAVFIDSGSSSVSCSRVRCGFERKPVLTFYPSLHSHSFLAKPPASVSRRKGFLGRSGSLADLKSPRHQPIRRLNTLSRPSRSRSRARCTTSTFTSTRATPRSTTRSSSPTGASSARTRATKRSDRTGTACVSRC